MHIRHESPSVSPFCVGSEAQQGGGPMEALTYEVSGHLLILLKAAGIAELQK